MGLFDKLLYLIKLEWYKVILKKVLYVTKIIR